MKRNILCMLGVLFFSSLNTVAQQISLTLNRPSENEKVPERPFVQGTVSDPKATIWVIVHPMDTSNFWVQPSVSVKQDLPWYCGPMSVERG